MSYRQLASCVLGLVLAACVLEGALLYASGWRAAVVVGQSMEPTVPLGSLVVVRPAGPGMVEGGQLVQFFDTSGRTTLHRVVAVDPAGLVTRGDNNPVVDRARVPFANIEGIYAFHVPWVGRVVAGGLPTVFPVVALLCAAILVAPGSSGPRRPGYVELRVGFDNHLDFDGDTDREGGHAHS
jgi:signal peptidase